MNIIKGLGYWMHTDTGETFEALIKAAEAARPARVSPERVRFEAEAIGSNGARDITFRTLSGRLLGSAYISDPAGGCTPDPAKWLPGTWERKRIRPPGGRAFIATLKKGEISREIANAILAVRERIMSPAGVRLRRAGMGYEIWERWALEPILKASGEWD